MSFTLRMSFHGMCLFVRDGTQALHVLLPATGGVPGDGGEAGCCVEAHAPRLIFDSAHLRQNQTAFDDALVHWSLKKRKLEFADVGSPLSNALPPELAKVGQVRGDVFSGENNDLLVSRVLLRNGSCSDYAKGACWSWQGQVRRLSHVIEWSVADLPGDSLDLPVQGLGGAFAGAAPTLYPVNGVVELQVWHAPHTELPPDSLIPDPPSRGGEAHHLSAFGRLLVNETYDLPTYEPNACPDIENPGKYDEGERGAATWSCTSAEGDPP